MTVVFFTMAISLGVFMAVQTSINGQLRIRIGDPWQSALISTSVSTISLFVVSFAMTRQPIPPVGRIMHGPWWIWTGGLLGACIVAGSLFLVSRLGSAVLFALLVTGQMCSALAMDHYGVLGLHVHHVNAQRIVGVALLLTGVALIRLF